MKFCMKCKEKFETEGRICSNCGSKLYELPEESNETSNEYEAAEIVTTMMITGIL